MHKRMTIIKPTITFFLYWYPLDFKIKPKIIDERGIGVIKKKTHIFSVKRPFASDIAPTKAAAPKIDSKEAANSKIEVFLHRFGIGVSTVFAGFLYIHE